MKQARFILDSGAIMASPDEFSVTIKGRGGHGAKPHETIDPIVIMAEFILSAQKLFLVR